MESKPFFAMVGLGPIVEGYSLIATKEHIPSMLDLSLKDSRRLCEFTEQVRQRLRPPYGNEIIITEHGRVPTCEYRDKEGRESHCFHAHRLVFPIALDLTPYLKGYRLKIEEYADFLHARKAFAEEGEYLYYERPDGTCLVAGAPRRLVRQFFRYKIAEYVGHPELASWRKYPRLKVVEAATRKLMLPGE